MMLLPDKIAALPPVQRRVRGVAAGQASEVNFQQVAEKTAVQLVEQERLGRQVERALARSSPPCPFAARPRTSAAPQPNSCTSAPQSARACPLRARPASSDSAYRATCQCRSHPHRRLRSALASPQRPVGCRTRRRSVGPIRASDCRLRLFQLRQYLENQGMCCRRVLAPAPIRPMRSVITVFLLCVCRPRSHPKGGLS